MLFSEGWRTLCIHERTHGSLPWIEASPLNRFSVVLEVGMSLSLFWSQYVKEIISHTIVYAVELLLGTLVSTTELYLFSCLIPIRLWYINSKKTPHQTSRYGLLLNTSRHKHPELPTYIPTHTTQERPTYPHRAMAYSEGQVILYTKCKLRFVYVFCQCKLTRCYPAPNAQTKGTIIRLLDDGTYQVWIATTLGIVLVRQ